MLDDALTGASTPLPRCMWCSAELPSDHETTCPTCGATLIGEGDNQVPGVTAIDAEAIIRAGRDAKPRQRSRLMSWISGEYPEDEAPAPPGSLDPPSADVRREMLRLELEAQVANAQAEVEAMAADEAIAEGGSIPKDILNQEGLFEPPTIEEPVAEPAAATGTSTEPEAAAAAAPGATEPAAESGDATPA
jgi:hypothetical protein